MRLRLAAVNDLIAPEGKYHQNCRNEYSYSTSKTKKEAENTDIAFLFLCKELEYAAEQKKTGSSTFGRLAAISGHSFGNRGIYSPVVFQSWNIVQKKIGAKSG